MSVEAVDPGRRARPSPALLERSNRLGADPRNTNYAGGNTSAKGTGIDPVTGTPVELLWVKGSGGDLGTLTEAGLAVLRLDRLRALVDVYPGVEREDEMVAAFDYCLHGRGGAAPSIDTAMHGLVDAAHVDHLHPDSGIALATAADGEALTRRCFGDRVAWVDWRRPGFQLGLDMAAIRRDAPGGDRRDPRRPRDHGLGRHLRRVRGALARDHPDRRAVHRGERPARPVRRADRRLRAAARGGAPRPRGRAPAARPRAGLDRPAAGRPLHRQRGRARLPRPRRASAAGGARDVVPRPLPAHQGPADGPRPAAHGGARGRRSRACASCTRPTARTTRAYYERHATPDSPPMRGADPAIVLVPGIGMFSFGANKQTARVAGEFYVNAINVMRGAEALSTYAPIAEVGEVPDRVLGARGGQAGADADAEAARGACRVRDRRRIRDRQGDRPSARRGGCLRRRRRHRCGERRGRRSRARRDRHGDQPSSPTSPTRRRSSPPSRRAVLAFGGVDLVVNNAGLSISKPLLETTIRDWDLQHDVMARGSFLVSREAARILIDQAMGGDLVYIVSKNALFAGPNNVAYGVGQGRPGPPGPAARGRARPVRDPGQRRQPRRRRPRLGDLRQGLGRGPGADLRHPRGQARRVLCAADAAQARGPPGARGGRGLRPDRRRPEPDDGVAHPGRCGCGGGLPAVTGRARRRRRSRRVEWPGDGRAGRARHRSS